MENLRQKIRQELNSYQEQVAARLTELVNQGLMSHHEYERLIIDAKATGKAIIDGFDANPNIPQDLVESYVYSLFERYKREVEDKIRELTQKSEQRDKFQSLWENLTANLNPFIDFPQPSQPKKQKKNHLIMTGYLLEAAIKMLWMIGPSIILIVGLSWTINKILPSGIPILPNWFMHVGTSFLKMVHGAANIGEVKLATGTAVLVSAMLTGVFWRNLLLPATIIAGFVTLLLSFLQDP